jgi:hypothetical protein
VAATSASNAWAVGKNFDVCDTNTSRTLIEHWNGRKWAVQPSLSPSPGGASQDSSLSGVAATSATNAWAVGANGGDYGPGQTLIEHWNGRKWAVQPSPSPGGTSRDCSLSGVAATSVTNAWAVGDCTSGALIEHWNGKTWTVQPSPSRGGASQDSYLSGVTATSPTNAWAVGYSTSTTSGMSRTLIEHWNGKRWTVQPSLNPAGGAAQSDYLSGIAATSPINAWAVGSYGSAAGGQNLPSQPLIEHWNGKRWTVQGSISPRRGAFPPNELSGVAATSPTNAWAVGDWTSPTARTLIERWHPGPSFTG